MNILIAGGGTGGHLFPGIAVAEALRRLRPECAISFAGTRRGLEARVLPREGWSCHFLAVRGIPRRPSPALARALAAAPWSLAQAWSLVGRLRPDVVVGTGGYASGPAAAAAAMRGVPVVLLEQNLAPGVTTRMAARFAREVHVSYEETAERLPRGTRVRVSGNPVRRSVLAPRREQGIARWGLDPARRTLLVLGGSRGARGLNRLVAAALVAWKDPGSWQCLWQAGEEDRAGMAERCAGAPLPVRVEGFISAMGEAYAAADLVICRAGATTVAELTARGLAAILVPYPWAAGRHQEENARWLENRGAAITAAEREWDGDRLSRLLGEIASNPSRLASMAASSRALGRPEADESVARAVIALAESGEAAA